MIFATFNKIIVLKAPNSASLSKIQALSILKMAKTVYEGKIRSIDLTGNWPPYPARSYRSEIMIQTDYIKKSLQFNIY